MSIGIVPGMCLFLSTPSARRATGVTVLRAGYNMISIHALREEGDSMSSFGLPLIALFLSTPSARRATTSARRYMRSGSLFLSTPSARRATRAGRECKKHLRAFLSTPSARRATSSSTSSSRHSAISIHALREEGDEWRLLQRRARHNFYPRPPRGGRPATSWPSQAATLYFYPRPPRGGRRQSAHAPADAEKFLSTPSARRATRTR